MFYVQLVTQYLVTTEFDDDTVQAIMDEALKYEAGDTFTVELPRLLLLIVAD